MIFSLNLREQKMKKICNDDKWKLSLALSKQEDQLQVLRMEVNRKEMDNLNYEEKFCELELKN